MSNPTHLRLGHAEEYQAIITARDLETYAAEIPWSSLSWSRTLDEVSTASVVIPDVFGGLRCNIELGETIVPWRFGLRIERNGDLVWAGPITNVERPVRSGMGADFVTVNAMDKMVWMQKRTVTQDLPYEDRDAGFIFRDLIADGTSLDDVFNLASPDVTTTYNMTRNVVALDFEYIYDILDELARAAIDYTVIGNELAVFSLGDTKGWLVARPDGDERIQPTDDPYGRYISGLFTDDAWTQRPGYTLDGFAQANNVYVPGADSGEAGFRRFWTANDVDPLDGLLTYVDVNPLYRPQEGTPISADAVFQQRATSLLELRRDTPTIISGGSLSPEAPVRIDYLIPGALWSIDLAEHGLARLLTVMRLKRVDVEVSVGSGGIVESVAPTLIPLGTDPGT